MHIEIPSTAIEVNQYLLGEVLGPTHALGTEALDELGRGGEPFGHEVRFVRQVLELCRLLLLVRC